MRSSTYLIVLMVIILISVIGGTFIFNRPSWAGVFFYIAMFASLMILAGHWLLKSKH